MTFVGLGKKITSVIFHCEGKLWKWIITLMIISKAMMGFEGMIIKSLLGIMPGPAELRS